MTSESAWISVEHEATELDFGAWVTTLAPRLGTLVRGYFPGAAIDARRRELVSAVVAGAAGADGVARMHAAWLDVLGPAELDEVDDEVLAWAIAAVGEGPPLEGSDLPMHVSREAQVALAAIVAHAVVTAATAQRAESVVDRLMGRRQRSLVALSADLVACAIGVPFVAPIVVAGAACAALGRLAPPAAVLEVDGEPNLLAQLLAETLPTWLGSAWGRTVVALLPVEVPVAWRSGLAEATVRVGRGRIQVSNGVAEDAWALFDGEVDNLLRAGSHSLTRELRTARLGL
ncbi:MAG: hypothetical protein ABIP03_04240, partial [Aquihabitans sp.]